MGLLEDTMIPFQIPEKYIIITTLVEIFKRISNFVL